jgi:uncharacterized protein YdeI (YjbR/CyaY-like superfamily)
MRPKFFATSADFRRWLETNHDKAEELYVGFYKKVSGKPSIMWSEAVDQALCFGWIDGVRKSIDESSYMNRFTPRRPRSTWSAVNVAKVRDLTRRGLMHPAGMAAFEKRSDDRTATYSFEQREAAKFDKELERRFRANKDAWSWFQTQPPGYKKTATHWVMSAKRQETRHRRLTILIDDSADGRRIAQLTPPGRGR